MQLIGLIKYMNIEKCYLTRHKKYLEVPKYHLVFFERFLSEKKTARDSLVRNLTPNWLLNLRTSYILPYIRAPPPSESSENGFANTVEVRNTLSPNRRMRHHFPSTFFNHAKYVIIDFLSNLWAWTSNCGYVISCNGIILLHCIIPSTTTF